MSNNRDIQPPMGPPKILWEAKASLGPAIASYVVKMVISFIMVYIFFILPYTLVVNYINLNSINYGYYSYTVQQFLLYWMYLGIFIYIIILILGLLRALRVRNVRAYITEQAIGVRVARGAFSYSEHEFPFSQVYKVDVNRGFWDRVFGTGTMTIHLVSHERTGKYFFQVPHIRDYDYGKQLIYNMQLNWKSQVNRASNPGTNININLSGIPGMQPASPIANQPAQATDTEGSINSEGIAKITFYAAQPAKISGAMIANTNIVATPEDIWPNSINAGQNYLTIRFRNMQGLQKGYHIIIINTVEGKSITVPVKYE